MAKIVKLIANIIFIIIILLLATYFVFRVTGKVEIYVVKTGSMEEKIHVGDYILIYRKSSYNVGDVVTFTSNDGFITHRIIKKDGSKIITKGDANNTEDSEIVESNIVGKVILSGGILNFIINYKYVIVCILLSLYLFSCYFEKKNNNNEVYNDNNLNDSKEIDNKQIDEDNISDNSKKANNEDTLKKKKMNK